MGPAEMANKKGAKVEMLDQYRVSWALSQKHTVSWCE